MTGKKELFIFSCGIKGILIMIYEVFLKDSFPFGKVSTKYGKYWLYPVSQSSSHPFCLCHCLCCLTS